MRLAINKGAASGESDNAAVMFVRELRKRSADIGEFTKSVTYSPPYQPYQRQATQNIMPFGKYKGEYLENIPVSYLVWVFKNCENISVSLKTSIQDILDDNGIDYYDDNF